jgi:hypothetical protein
MSLFHHWGREVWGPNLVGGGLPQLWVSWVGSGAHPHILDVTEVLWRVGAIGGECWSIYPKKDLFLDLSALTAEAILTAWQPPA